MSDAPGLSSAVIGAAELMRDQRNEVADTTAAIIASMCDPDMVSSLWPVARLGQHERLAFGVLLLHFVGGGFTAIRHHRQLSFDFARLWPSITTPDQR